MQKSKKIDKISSIEKLEYIRENVTNNVIESRIEASVTSIKKEKDTISLLRMFSEMNIRFAEESDTLKQEAPEYNKKYATKINGKFSMAYESLSCIKSQVFFLYRIMNAVSSKPSKKSLYYSNVDTNSIEWEVNHTMIGSKQPYWESLFDDKTEIQKRLIHEIMSFLNCLDSNLVLCLETIKEEKRIANDEEETYYLFEKQIEEVYEYVKGKKGKSVNAKYQDLLAADDNHSVTKVHYHELLLSDMSDLSLAIHNKKLSIYTPLERKTYGEDPEKLSVYRIVLSNLDKVVQKITGEILVYVRQYTQCCSSQSRFHQCFVKSYSNIGGQLKVVKYQRFNQACTDAPAHLELTDGYRDFQTKMDKFVNQKD